MNKSGAAKIQRRKPSQARSRGSVDAIVEASAQVLEQHGYRAATTNRIAERAGVSVGTLYQYFNNKDEIFDSLIEREAARYLEALEQNMPGAEVPHRAAIRQLLEAAYAHHRLVLGVRLVMRNLPSTAYSERSKAIREEMHRLVLRFLELRGPIAGLEDLSLAADVFIAQCEGLTYLGRVTRAPQELIAILTDSLSRYLFAGTDTGE
jgi:AcrR family transcriptional regulator